jgi:anti-sigma factor RsiW
MSEQEYSSGCESALAELSGYLDDALSPAEREAIARHLDTCPACQAELELLRLVTQSLQQAPRPEPSDSMRQRLLARVEADLAPRRVEIVCTERHGDQVTRRQDVLTLNRPIPTPWPSAGPTPPVPVFQQQSRREREVRPGFYQVIDDHYGRSNQ